MKVAVLSESSADEAALRILVDGLLGRATQPVALNAFAARRGWQAVLGILPAVLKYLHYQTAAEAFVVILDSDKSPVHQPAHDQPGGADKNCRLCGLREKASQALNQLKPVPGRAALRPAFGLAVPTLEAWLRCGRDPHVTEAAWLLALQSGKYPYDGKRLKKAVYGTDKPTLAQETQGMVAEATRLAQDLSGLERWFPDGFGGLARDVRGW